MVLEVLKYPDQRLRQKAKAVSGITPALKTLAANMLETMYDQHGIGLAAVQVGEPVRFLVIDTRPRDEEGEILTEGLTELEKQVQQPVAIFNPEIVKATDKTSYEEGCLSVPGFFETVDRFNYVEVIGMDAEGNSILIKTDGLLAICLQHEMDHLDGKLFIDRLSLLKSNRIKSRIQKHGYPTPEELEEERQEARSRRKAAKAQVTTTK